MASGALALRWRPGLCSRGLLPRVAAAPPAGGRRWAAAPRPRGFCAEGAGPAGEAQAPGAAADAGPRVLWRARGLEKQFGEVQSALDTSAAVSAGGFWMALMGIAPFTPPNMFMVAMVLAIMQVRLAHTWLTRQLHSQARRHVLEVEQSSPYQSDGVAFTQLKLRCEGGLTRTLHLERAKTSGSMQASVGNVLSKGGLHVFMDRDLGEPEDEDALKAALESPSVICKEELEITPYEGESQEEASKLVPRLHGLTSNQLGDAEAKGRDSPAGVMAQMVRSAKVSSTVILGAGFLVGVSGRTVVVTGPAPDASSAAAQ